MCSRVKRTELVKLAKIGGVPHSEPTDRQFKNVSQKGIAC